VENLLDEQERINVEVAELLTSALPPTWRSATLEIEFVRLPNGDHGLVHKIRGPEGSREFVSPPDETYAVAYRLYNLSVRAGHPWQRVQYLVIQMENGDWAYEVTFKYPT